MRTFTLFLSLFLVLALLGAGCSDAPIIYPEGGYDYPKEVKDSNFYCYPLRDSINKQHKIAGKYDFPYAFFDEPNLSLHPMPRETFRFFLFGFKQYPLIIVLTPDTITTKIATTSEFFVKDTGALTTIEKMHYELLHEDVKYTAILSSQKRFDSLAHLYPELRNPEYRRYIERKLKDVPNKNFHYSTSKIHITRRQFTMLVTQINKSGYWGLPHFLTTKEQYTDGFEYILEANTPKQYGYVSADDINDEKLFRVACQHLINAAGLGMNYRVYRGN